MKTMTSWEVYVRSDVYAGAVNEDGETPDQLCFYIICENAFGDRYRSKMSFTTEDFGDFRMVGARKYFAAEWKAEQFLLTVQDGIKKGGDPVTSAKWFRTNPNYNSEAYAAYGQAAEVAWEKAADWMYNREVEND